MIRVVTTTSKKGFEEYGHRMVSTFDRYWSRDIRLSFYIEDMDTADLARYRSVDVCRFPRWFNDWKERYKDAADPNGRDPNKNRDHRPYDFRRDCVKFAHKVAAVTDAGLDMDDGLLIWIDGDTLTHASVDAEWLYRLFPGEDKYLAWLARNRGHPECGFLMFRCWHDVHLRYMKEMRRIYESGDVYDLSETHDSFVFQHVTLKGIKKGWMPQPHNLAGAASIYHHPFIHCELGSRLDHAKGARKKLGRTSKVEVGGRRREAHWK